MKPRIHIQPERDPVAWLLPDYSSRPVGPQNIVLRFYPGRWRRDEDDEGDRLPLEVVLRQNAERAVASYVWFKLVLEYGLPPLVDAQEMTRIINEGKLDHLFDRIAAGHEVVWDGSRHYGRLTQDAQDADWELIRWLNYDAPLIQGDNAGLWDIRDYMPPGELERMIEPNRVADLTDDDIAVLAYEIEQTARIEEQIVLYDVEEWLTEQRNQARALLEAGVDD